MMSKMYLFSWLMILLVITSTYFIDEQGIRDQIHIERFTNSVTLSNECKIRDDLEETLSLYDSYYLKKKWAFGINCDISSSKVHFKFDADNENNCYKKRPYIYLTFYMQLTFPKSRSLILGEWFRFDNLLKFIYCYEEEWWVRIRNLKGFDISLFESDINKTQIWLVLELANFEFSFYSNNTLIRSCEDIKSPKTFNFFSFFTIIKLYNVRPSEEKICPLFFQNTNALRIEIYQLANTFYKSNVPKFISETFDEMHTKIELVEIYDSVDIDLNRELLHSSIFRNLERIVIAEGSLNSIEVELFESLRNLREIEIWPLTFRELNHKVNGIEWMKAINRHLSVDLNDTKQLEANINRTKFIYINCIKGYDIGFIKLSDVLPEEDFCLYRDFPFNQMVVFVEQCIYDSYKITAFETTCTYLWFYKFLSYYRKSSNLEKLYYLKYVFNDTEIFKLINDCNFEQRLGLCNRSNYQVRDVWTASDYKRLNKILEFAFRISNLFVSLFGAISNLLVIIVILHKTNKDIFYGFKQYVYLWLNSAFSLSILLIQLFSWFSECFWPYQLFCPRTHQFVFFQYFKIVFQVMLINALRFMCNFTYLMFAINRIAVLVKGQNEVCEKISKWGVRKFLAITFSLSLLLSSTKYFNYVVNFDHPEADYPIREKTSVLIWFDYNHMDTIFKVIFLLTSLSDFLNHFVFTCTNLFVDVVMLVKLRRTLAEKLAKLSSMNLSRKIVEKRKEENRESMNRAVRMVVINSLISILLKLPLMILPIITITAQFYYSDQRTFMSDNFFEKSNYEIAAYLNRGFGYFFYLFKASAFPDFIDSFGNFCFSLSLSLSFFVYITFDKNIYHGFKRIFIKKKVIIINTQNAE